MRAARWCSQETIESAYFWSNIASLGLLGCLFIIIIYQHRVQRSREWTAAEMLAQYEHSLSLANAQVEEATKRNCGLMEALTLLRESALRSQALPARHPDHPRRTGAAKPSSKHTAFASVGSKGQRCQTGGCEHGKHGDNDAPRQSDRTLQTGG